MSEFLKLFGIYDLQEEGRKWCIREFGEQYGDEFVEKYVNINRGIPIGGIFETIEFIGLVEKIKKDLQEKTLAKRLRKAFKRKEI